MPRRLPSDAVLLLLAIAAVAAVLLTVLTLHSLTSDGSRPVAAPPAAGALR